MRSPKVKFLTIFTLSILITKMSFASSACFNEAGTMFRIEPNLIKAIALVESNLKKDSIGKNRDKKNNIKSFDYGLMQINQMHIPMLKKRGIIKDERDLLDNPCLNIKIGTEILYKHFSRCGMTWQCLGTYNAGFAMDNQKKRLQYAQKIYIVYTRLNELDNRKALAK
ncbi:TPA: lytic transglycosylase domain-containing protein [Escherichia coli]|jgi:soluble lytic murein transglycosylase-like protein|uniref:Lytic transglycosylase domain-containing protein n=7 Tax=Escherichia coli TaxID=562 RepID=A0A2J1DJD9_ECOLX|nr:MULTISPECIES: lytic transglycosylase domain-containing protein [Enterobacteriaceae]EEZ8698948.1 lytic transglycosylase domain-containing protein [Escherichia coli O91]EEZ9857162.1 lytic transglycosylase domain-containing protein [Escherichia coli O54]EFA4121884.1 lytic transglycosylase domain-containing protein [Escherichia coli O49:H9]EFA5477174.1 peptidoglycan-binding protein [Escherichia coli O8]EFN7361624.1 peptidoglycan-binding protein [Escherichia coli O180:H14]EFO3148359.1 peptidogl